MEWLNLIKAVRKTHTEQIRQQRSLKVQLCSKCHLNENKLHDYSSNKTDVKKHDNAALTFGRLLSKTGLFYMIRIIIAISANEVG